MEACAKSLGYICEQARHRPVSPEMAIPFQVPSEALKGVQRSCGHWSTDQSQTHQHVQMWKLFKLIIL